MPDRLIKDKNVHGCKMVIHESDIESKCIKIEKLPQLVINMSLGRLTSP